MPAGILPPQQPRPGAGGRPAGVVPSPARPAAPPRRIVPPPPEDSIDTEAPDTDQTDAAIADAAPGATPARATGAEPPAAVRAPQTPEPAAASRPAGEVRAVETPGSSWLAPGVDTDETQAAALFPPSAARDTDETPTAAPPGPSAASDTDETPAAPPALAGVSPPAAEPDALDDVLAADAADVVDDVGGGRRRAGTLTDPTDVQLLADIGEATEVSVLALDEDIASGDIADDDDLAPGDLAPDDDDDPAFATERVPLLEAEEALDLPESSPVAAEPSAAEPRPEEVASSAAPRPHDDPRVTSPTDVISASTSGPVWGSIPDSAHDSRAGSTPGAASADSAQPPWSLPVDPAGRPATAEVHAGQPPGPPASAPPPPGVHGHGQRSSAPDVDQAGVHDYRRPGAPGSGSQGIPALTPPGFPHGMPALTPPGSSLHGGHGELLVAPPAHGPASGYDLPRATSGSPGGQEPASSDSARVAAPGAPRSDELDPSPEYIAAREAALEAIRAQKARIRASGQVPALDDGAPAAQAPGRHAHPSGSHAGQSNSYKVAAFESAGLGIWLDDEDDAPPVTIPAPVQAIAYEEPARDAIPGRTHAKIPAERNAARIIIGLLAILVGVGLLAVWLPTKSPLTTAERTLRQQRLDEARATLAEAPKFDQRFSPSMFWKAQAAAGGFVVVGLIWLLSGFVFRPQVEVVCKQCVRWVIADKDGVVLKCPVSSHQAGYSYGAIALTGALILCVAAAFLTVALGSIVRG